MSTTGRLNKGPAHAGVRGEGTVQGGCRALMGSLGRFGWYLVDMAGDHVTTYYVDTYLRCCSVAWCWWGVCSCIRFMLSRLSRVKISSTAPFCITAAASPGVLILFSTHTKFTPSLSLASIRREYKQPSLRLRSVCTHTHTQNTAGNFGFQEQRDVNPL